MLLILKKRVNDITNELKKKNAISEETYDKVGPVGSKPKTIYLSPKVNKPL